MFKKFIDNLKFNKFVYQLEIIEVGNFKDKIKAFNKISTMKLTKEMGVALLDRIGKISTIHSEDFNLTISLVSLLFKNYYPEYSVIISKLFPKFISINKYEILNMLASSNNPDAINCYKKLLLKYYKELENIPLGTLASDSSNYNLVFPELYECFKFDVKKNNLLLLLNDFINEGVVPLKHLNKYKKLINNSLLEVLKEGSKYKYKKDSNFMADKDYVSLRIFLETALNIEYYVSSKESKDLIDKLFKKKDNQLKLFVLENYVRKNKKIDKINLNLIAKDNLSRYPLYSFLMFNNLERLMPKKYKNNILLSESDLAINFSIFYGYEILPYDFQLLEEREFEGYKYYIYKFKTKFNYNEEILDPATDYILKNIKVDKDLINNGETTYIGISGGYNLDVDPSLIEKPFKELKVSKYNREYEKIVNDLFASEKLTPISKIKETAKKKKIFDKKVKDIKDEVNDQITSINNENVDVTIEVDKRPSLLRRIFSFSTFLTLVCLLVIASASVLVLYVNDIDILNLKKNDDTVISTLKIKKLKAKDQFTEIGYRDIFTRPENEYYVLFFKGNADSKNTYFNYIDLLIENKYRFYFVNIEKEENKPIFQGNETGFVISDDTLLKVKEREYEFYVIKEVNILKEFNLYNKDIIKKQEEEKKKLDEEKEKEIEKSNQKTKDEIEEKILKTAEEDLKKYNEKKSKSAENKKKIDDKIKSSVKPDEAKKDKS